MSNTTTNERCRQRPTQARIHTKEKERMTIEFNIIQRPEDLTRHADYVADYAATVLRPLEAVKEIDEDGNVERRLFQNGEEVELEDIYAVLVGAVGPEILRAINYYETDIDRDADKFTKKHHKALVNDWNRCYDIRELENIYRAVWFEVNYRIQAQNSEVPHSRPWVLK